MAGVAVSCGCGCCSATSPPPPRAHPRDLMPARTHPGAHPRHSRGFPGTPLIAGSRNTLAIDAEGQLWSWGWNDRGTLGHGHRALERKPRRVHGLKGVRIVQVRPGAGHVASVGGRARRRLRRCSVSRERSRAAAVRGLRKAPGRLVSPLRVVCAAHPLPLPPPAARLPARLLRGHLKAAIGGWHCLAVSDEGQVYAWGGNEYSQCGLQVGRPGRGWRLRMGRPREWVEAAGGAVQVHEGGAARQRALTANWRP
jgi:hypothetical protein